MFCRNCGEPMNEEQAVCLKCGVPTGKGDKFCPNCGKEVAAEAVVCISCGAALKKENTEYLNGKDKITIALICFFLGGLGIHNFMLGETKKGIVKIVASCCCGIGYILTLIDFVRILCDKYEVDPNKFI